jgi:predicted RNase H-like nuclease (RuvC/YqgF family)
VSENLARWTRVALCDEVNRLRQRNGVLSDKIKELEHFIASLPADLHAFALEHRERVALARVNQQWASRIVELETKCAKCGLRVIKETAEYEARNHPVKFERTR